MCVCVCVCMLNRNTQCMYDSYYYKGCQIYAYIWSDVFVEHRGADSC